MFNSPREYMEYLYSDDRLALRANIFVNYSLPQLEIASSAHTIKHIVAYSDTLPAKYQSILSEAAERFPFIILERGTEHHKAVLPGTPAWTSTIGSLREDYTCFGTYRLDDDDILPVDYFDQMAPYIRPSNIGMQVSLGTGVEALYENGRFLNLRQSYYPMFSAGLMSICGFDSSGRLKQPSPAPHHLSDRANPVILDSKKIGYMRLRHVTQDGALRNGGVQESDRRQKIVTHMNRAPALESSTDPAAVFPVLSGTFETPGTPSSTDEIVLKPGDLSTDPTIVPIDTDKRMLKIMAQVQCSSDAIDRNALISLDLRNSNGEPFEPSIHVEHFRSQGLSYSTIPGIGFFRYLKTRPGRTNSTLAVTLPADVKCRGISLRRWKNHSTIVHVSNLAISTV